MKGISLSDFTIEEFTYYLNNKGKEKQICCETAPFNSVYQILYDDSAPYWKNYNFMVLWTMPSIIEKFKQILEFNEVSSSEIINEVEQFADLVIRRSQSFDKVLVASWTIPSYIKSWGIDEMKYDKGIKNILLRMNLKLTESFANSPNIHVLDTQKWINAIPEAYSDKSWYMGKVPFKSKVFIEAVNDVLAAFDTFEGNVKKLIVLDLDNTLWGGIVGDDGWENLNIGGTNFIGEAYKDFQKVLKSLKNRGVILAIASKNEENLALEVFAKHPEMILKIEDFSAIRINWDDKSKNISELANELNLGLQSFVFIDDSPIERARVRESLPEVLVPEWPNDVTLYKSALLSLNCFNVVNSSEEDLKRTQMYHEEKKRADLKKNIPSLAEWLKNLELKVEVETLNDVNTERILQLMNKTNQMNLSTRRLDKKELTEWLEDKSRNLWAFTVSDKFGDYGLTGVISAEFTANKTIITDFILSCRVMSRKIEETMMHFISVKAKKLKSELLEVVYIPTPKNAPMLNFLKNSSLKESMNLTFTFSLESLFPKPDFVKLIDKTDEN